MVLIQNIFACTWIIVYIKVGSTVQKSLLVFPHVLWAHLLPSNLLSVLESDQTHNANALCCVCIHVYDYVAAIAVSFNLNAGGIL